MTEIILGIDLGTTFSEVAYVDDDGWPRLLPNAEGKVLTPSVVLIEDGSVLVGDAAANQAIVKRENVVRWIKRSMGDESYVFKGLSPTEISAEILRKLKRDSEAALGATLDKAVITCPAYFSALEVENTRKAGEIAGFEVMEIVREPVAAAVYYGIENMNEGEKALVYDLGGGTLDATILEIKNSAFCPLATMGDRELGGHDWTSDLLDHVCRKLSTRFGRDPRDDPSVHQMLYQWCETAKYDLSKISRAIIPCHFDGRTEEVVVEQSTFEELTEYRIGQTIQRCHESLAKAGLTWRDINKVLLVGGSTRLRRVPLALEEASGKTPIQTAQVDTMVALGAAVLAKGVVRKRKTGLTDAQSKSGSYTKRDGLISVNLRRSCARNLGTRAVVRDGDSSKIVNSVIIPCGSEIPTKAERDDYSTTVRGQAYFDVPIVEFDDIGEDVVIGTYRFKCRPNTPARAKIAVTFGYDQSGIIDVDARDTSSGDLLPKERVQYEEPHPGEANMPPAPVSAMESEPPAVDIMLVFDTTGSMYHCLEKVRDHLAKIIQEIHRDLPIARLAIMAHGDHCDEGSAYLVKSCPFTKKTADLVSFVKNVEATSGGDAPEAIEDALWEANSADWDEHAQKAIVLVGDSCPHEQAECPYGRDYRAEAEKLKRSGVRVYSVWCSSGGYYSSGRDIFEWLASMSGGKFLDLENIDDVCDLLVAVAMKEGDKLEEFRDRLISEDRLTHSKTLLLESLGLDR